MFLLIMKVKLYAFVIKNKTKNNYDGCFSEKYIDDYKKLYHNKNIY